jgi:hypothetical protein
MSLNEEKIYRKELIQHRARLDEENEREKKANIKRKSKELMKNVRLVILVSSVLVIGYIVFLK